ncbi:S-norcoclaurine synthase [Thalictrum thalictroides]|uniref:S-norcoclaurine synthase n=1 Tax=Thalictrum thalictroides TaxID=46969 RepID=A0A7J6WVY5_THATH|nr:S-norcoclaurine synthase [Thalictrum thalictroides]
MAGQIEHELEVNVHADVLWEIYGGLEFGRLAIRLLPKFFSSLEVIEGDGGVGTVLKLVFPEGAFLSYQKEKFTVIDNEKRLKVVEVIEGGFLELGFSFFRLYLQIIEKNPKSSIIKSTLEYEVKPGFEANVSLVSAQNQVLVTIAEAITNYVAEKI